MHPVAGLLGSVGRNTTTRLFPAGNAGSSSTENVPSAGTPLMAVVMLIDPTATPPPGSELGSTPALNVNLMFALMNTPAGQAPGTVPFAQSGSDAPSAV